MRCIDVSSCSRVVDKYDICTHCFARPEWNCHPYSSSRDSSRRQRCNHNHIRIAIMTIIIIILTTKFVTKIVIEFTILIMIIFIDDCFNLKSHKVY